MCRDGQSRQAGLGSGVSRWQVQDLCGARAGGYNYALHEAAFPVDLTFPVAVIATFFVSLLVLLYVIHHRLQARRLPASD